MKKTTWFRELSRQMRIQTIITQHTELSSYNLFFKSNLLDEEINFLFLKTRSSKNIKLQYKFREPRSRFSTYRRKLMQKAIHLQYNDIEYL